MGLLIGFLTLLLVVACLLLILLILVQLPKKEAGVGVAFGGGTADALFGAGSGTALTKITKYAAGLFIGLSLVLTILNVQRSKSSSRGLERALNKQSKTAATAITPRSITPTNQLLTLPAATNALRPMLTTNQISNAPAAATIKLNTNAVVTAASNRTAVAPTPAPAAPVKPQ